MARAQAQLAGLRSLALRGGEGPTDADLLGDVVAERDDIAFTALMRRHGPMVLGVCRRILRNEADAEDAFQATFLVLVRKAASIQPRSAIGNWLYGVAYSTALKACAANQRRRQREQTPRSHPVNEAIPDEEQVRLLAWLDEELARLPDIYRTAIVLCELEGKTLREVARQLGCPAGTIASRLARGRTLLGKRLAARGATGTANFSVLLAQVGPLSASMPASLVGATVAASTAGASVAPSILALTEGVLKIMLWKKLTSVLGIVLLPLVLGLGLAFSAGGRGAQPTAPPKAGRPAPAQKAGTAEEKTIRMALAREVKFPGFDDIQTTLNDAIDLFKNRYGLTLTIDEKAFKDEGVLKALHLDSARQLKIAVPRALTPAETQAFYILQRILRRLPSPSGATFVVRGKGIEITTRRALAAAKRSPEPPPAPSAEAMRRVRQADAFLKTPLDFYGFDDPKETLQEGLDALEKRHKIQFDVQERAFNDEQVPDVLRTEIASPKPIPPAQKRILGSAILATVLDRVPAPSKAVYVVRPSGVIEITTGAYLKAEAGRGK